MNRPRLGGGPAAVGSVGVVAALVGLLAVPAASAAPPGAIAAPSGHHAGPGGLTMERLDRGLVAATTSEGVFLSWRLLAPEVTGATAAGVAAGGSQ